MSERKEPPATTSSDPVEILRSLSDALTGTRDDLGRMPRLIRPMARRGFAKRTGRSFDDWCTLATTLLERAQRSDSLTRGQLTDGYEGLEADLERLAETYRTAPERAARFMRDQDTLARVQESSRAREGATRAVIELLRSLPA